jgi:hypothetical protein
MYMLHPLLRLKYFAARMRNLFAADCSIISRFIVVKWIRVANPGSNGELRFLFILLPFALAALFWLLLINVYNSHNAVNFV